MVLSSSLYLYVWYGGRTDMNNTFKTVWIRFHSYQQKSSVVMDCGLQINKPLVFLTTLMVWRSDLGSILRWWDLPSGNHFCIFPWFLDSAYNKRCHVILMWFAITRTGLGVGFGMKLGMSSLVSLAIHFTAYPWKYIRS